MPEETTTKNKITFADLDIVLKVAPIIGLALLTYLQTLFPSKAEFDKLNQHLIQMDKKMTEMNILHNKQVITEEIKQINERLRALEIDAAKQHGGALSPSFNWSPMLPQNNSSERNSNSNRNKRPSIGPKRNNNKNSGNKSAAAKKADRTELRNTLKQIGPKNNPNKKQPKS